MGKLRNNESGFGVVEIILVLVIVALIGAVGYLVYKNHSKTVVTPVAATTTTKPATTSPAKTATLSTATPVANANLIKLSELGVEITVPDSIKDLTYKVFTYTGTSAALHDDSGKPLATTQANMSTSSLLADNTSCTPASSPLGILFKVDGTYPTNPTSDNAGGKLVKQFGGFYIGYSGGSAGGCDATQQRQAVGDALTTIQQIQ